MENLNIWLSKVAGSEATKNSYLLRIQNFGKYLKEKMGIEIEKLKEAYRQAKYTSEIEREKFVDKLQDVIEGYLAEVKTMGYSTLHEKVIISIISSYIKKGCGIRDIEITIPRRVFPKFHNRDITKGEIKKILEHASLRDRTFFLMMVESGLRPSTLLQLRYKHIKHDYEANKIPLKISLPSALLKDRIPDRFTFIGEDGVKLLKEYLSTRKDLNDNSLLFLPERPGSAKGETINETAMSQKFNKLVLKLGLDTPTVKGKPKSLRLYCLRKYFWNNMKCDTSFRSFWFCHKSIDDHYITTLDVERHREEYMKGYPYLRIFEPGQNSKVQELEIKLSEAYRTIGELQQKLQQSITLPELMELFKDTLPVEIYQKLQAKIKQIKV